MFHTQCVYILIHKHSVVMLSFTILFKNTETEYYGTAVISNN